MADRSEVARVLRDAADLIEPEGRWTQGGFARDANGALVASTSRNATCWCADGALRRVTGEHATTTPAWLALYHHIQPWDDGGVAGWNDAPERQQAEVVAALRAAADEAERANG